MTPESQNFLAAHGRSYLYVLAADGTVRGWPMIARTRDGQLVMTTYRKAPKTPHLRTARRATVIVTSDEGAKPFHYAVVEGPLTITDITPAMADAVTDILHGKGLAGSGYSDPAAREHFHARLLDGKRSLIEVGADSVQLFSLEDA